MEPAKIEGGNTTERRWLASSFTALISLWRTSRPVVWFFVAIVTVISICFLVPPPHAGRPLPCSLPPLLNCGSTSWSSQSWCNVDTSTFIFYQVYYYSSLGFPCMSTWLQLPFSSPTSASSAAFDLIHCDLRTSPIIGTSDFRYYLVIFNEYSHFYLPVPLKQKSCVSNELKIFFSYAHAQFGVPIHSIQTDNDTKFLNTTVDTLLSSLSSYRVLIHPNIMQGRVCYLHHWWYYVHPNVTCSFTCAHQGRGPCHLHISS
jgi:hypothetical protein